MADSDKLAKLQEYHALVNRRPGSKCIYLIGGTMDLRSWKTIFVAPALFASALAPVSSGAAEPPGCKQISGAVSPLVPLATCAAGYLGCFQGQFSGDLSGSFTSGLTKLQFVSASSITLEARTTIVSGNHTITTFDTGGGIGCAVQPSGAVACTSTSETLTIASGTGAYTQAYGTISLINVGFTQPGTYQGLLCKGAPSQGHRQQ
jgi:hypothetical protein